MDGGIGIASGFAALVTIAVQITKLSYGYMNDVRNAPSMQKAYHQEVSALTDVLIRIDEALQESEKVNPSAVRLPSFSPELIQECHDQLGSQKMKLENHTKRLLWPFQQKEMRTAIESLHRFRNVFADYLLSMISGTTSSISGNLADLRIGEHAAILLCKTNGKDQERGLLSEWLQDVANISGAKPETLAGTGAWFLAHSEYQNWRFGSANLIWCHGPPGVGKSVLASTAIDDISTSDDVLQAHRYVTYFFCDFLARKGQNDISILRSLLAQIVQQADKATVSILMKYRTQIQSTKKSTELLNVLVDICTIRPIFMVFDAIDELDTPRQVLSTFSELEKAGCKLLVTSREHPDIRKHFLHASQIDLNADSGDLCKYILQRFDKSDFEGMLDESHTIVTKTVTSANGLFLLAKLLMDQLLEQPTLKRMRKILDDPPTRLSAAYQSTMERIDAQPKPLVEIAHRLLGWITYAQRPLQMSEIIHAFAVDPEDDELDAENCPRQQTLLRVCHGLVEVDARRSTLGLVHKSAYDFLVSGFLMEGTITDIAKTSLAYLCLRTLASGPCSNIEEMRQRFEDLPFLSYAASHWGKHVVAASLEIHLNKEISRLLRDVNLRSSAVQALHYRDIKIDEVANAALATLPRRQDSIHLASYFGLEMTICLLIEEGVGVNIEDGQKWSSLHWAASRGHSKVVELLLDNGALINVSDESGWTPLFWPSFTGDIKILQLFLERNANHLASDKHGWTCLNWAVSMNQSQAVSLLLEHHKKSITAANASMISSVIVPPNGSQETLIEIAMHSKNLDLFDVLLTGYHDSDGMLFERLWEAGRFDPPISNIWRLMNKAELVHTVPGRLDRQYHRFGSKEADDKVTWTSRFLPMAIQDDKLLAVKLLIQMGADLNNCVYPRSPLHLAARRRDPQYVRLLIEHGADTEAYDSYGQTPLHEAILNGFYDTAVNLIAGGSDVNAKRQKSNKCEPLTPMDERVDEQTPLMLVCGLQTSHKDKDLRARLVELLLLHNAEVRQCDAVGKPTLHYAILSRDIAVIRQIVERENGVDVVDNNGLAAIHLASRSCNMEIIKLVAVNGVNLEVADDLGRTPLQTLAGGTDFNHGMNDLEEMFHLLATPSNINKLNNEYEVAEFIPDDHLRYHTALSEAIQRGNWKLVQIFLKAGARLPYRTDGLLTKALSHCQAKVVGYLLDHGVAPEEHAAGAIATGIQHRHYRHLGIVIRVEDLDATLNVLGDRGLLEINKSKGGLHYRQEESLVQIVARQWDSGSAAEVLVRHGCDPFESHGSFDAFLLAALQANLEFLYRIISAFMELAPAGHWLQHADQLPANKAEDIYDMICSSLRKSGQINERNLVGDTLLGKAASLENKPLVRSLLQNGADPGTARENWLSDCA